MRQAVFHRRPVAAPMQAQSRSKSLPAMNRGVVLNENLSAPRKPGGARRLDNWFPTLNGIRIRAGSEKFATIGSGSVTSLFTYVSGSTKEMFAADATKVFDITSPADPDVAPSAAITGQTGGVYSNQMFTTAAGEFLYIVNGEDDPQLYDGTDWKPVAGAALFSYSYDDTGDANWDNVSCLLHCEGSDASTTFTDSGPTGHTFTAGANAQIDTAQKKFGVAAGLFDGTGDVIAASDHAEFELGSGDFTIEFWVRFSAVAATQNIVAKYTSAPNLSYLLQWLNTNSLRFLYSTDGTATASKSFAWTPSTGTWYHVAVCRDGNNLRAFIDGTQIGSTEDVTGVTLYDGNANFTLGNQGTTLTAGLTGWMDDFRLTKAARYTANFTAPTARFPVEYNAFTVGSTLTGTTSAATGTIYSDDGAGTLLIYTITGTFQSGEDLTDADTGTATSTSATSSYQAAYLSGSFDVADLSHVWTYKKRLYFVEKGTLDYWATPSGTLGGTMIQGTLAGVFTKGGSLLTGGTWSLDSGDGLDDKIVFVSTEGEVAVYEGSDPADADNFLLIGVYDIAEPLGKRALLNAGGDLLIMTKEGTVPISQIVVQDKAALSFSAITRAIYPEWVKDVEDRSGDWEVLKWDEMSMGIVSPPQSASNDAYVRVVNLQTGAWAKYTGWDAVSMAVHDGQAYFGTLSGTIMKMESTGSDDGANYTCVAVGQFEDLGSPGAVKDVGMMRGHLLVNRTFELQLSVSTDYSISLPSPPNAIAALSGGGVWDTDVWDTAVWDYASEDVSAMSTWNSIGRSGFAIAPQIQVTCGTPFAPIAELVNFDILYEPGAIAV